MTGGWVSIVGLGPGADGLIAPAAMDVINQATDVIGYIPYVRRISPRPGLTLHASDNRVELNRAQHALTLARAGHKVAVVSSGDPGVFAMASAVFEAVDHGPHMWRDIDIRVIPGITACLAAAATVGAPLGHDFCTINLSDNLKPAALIEKRIQLAIEGDFAMAFYNPRSKSRPEGFARAMDILRAKCEDDRIIIFARAVSTPDQTIRVVALKDTTNDMADMRTVVLVGSSATRVIDRNGAPFVYTPRSVPV
ncbi:MAG: precorrin-3B C(17)-methyltransferase [Pseudomonadota bacterium]